MLLLYTEMTLYSKKKSWSSCWDSIIEISTIVIDIVDLAIIDTAVK